MANNNQQQNGQATPPPPEEPDLIDVMNDLQSKLVAGGQSLDVDLPQIAVVGSQSAGKSSVLENIVRKEFLPRGNGVVTRRPTLIQLHPTPVEEYAVFGHRPNDKFTDFSLVRQEIVNQMPERNAFSSVPIQLKIYSPNVLKLTLVDLPGIVKIAVDGQPDTNVREVRSMVLNHIRQKECLILAVTPANQDIATSDALDIAREVDPERARTIGVLTKIDLMDEGTNACDILENRQINLKRGYVGVVNRSQKDIDEGRDIQYTLERERNFFAEKQCYSHLRHRCGTPYLQRLLQRTLRQHIKAALPEVRNKLAQKLSECNRKLKLIREQVGEGTEDRQYYMRRLINSFIEDITIKLMGNSELIDSSTLSPGAYINYKLNTEVQQLLNLTLVPNEEELTVLITSLNGIKSSISVSSLALDAMNRKLMANYEYPMEQAVLCVQRVLVAAIEESAEKLKNYESTKNEVLYRIGRCVDRESERTLQKLRDHIQAEMFFVNLEHPDMDLSLNTQNIGKQNGTSNRTYANALSQGCDQLYPAVGPSKVWESTEPEGTEQEVVVPEGVPGNGPVPAGLGEKTKPLVKLLMRNPGTQRKVQYIMVVIAKYMEIVQKQISDLTIKYICWFLIKKVLDFIKLDLVPTLLTSPNLASLTEDCEDDFREKEAIETTCRVIKEALDAIQAF